MKKVLAAFVLLSLVAGIAYAQSISVSREATTNQSNDLIQVIPNGQPQAQSFYVPAGQLTVASVVTKVVPANASTGGYVYYFGNIQSDFLFEPTGTPLTYNYIYLGATPQDGAHECFFSTVTVTNTYLNALNSQTLNNAITAMTANTRYCYTYSLSNTSWDRSM